jgi:phosphoribulokinase
MRSDDDPFILDAELTLRDGLRHPDLTPFVDESDGEITLTERGGDSVLFIPGMLARERAAAIEESIWDRMQFASHLRSDRLGEFRVGTDVHRSESLALVQLLILYHMATARATVALGGEPGGGEEPVAVSQRP